MVDVTATSDHSSSSIASTPGTEASSVVHRSTASGWPATAHESTRWPAVLRNVNVPGLEVVGAEGGRARPPDRCRGRGGRHGRRPPGVPSSELQCAAVAARSGRQQDHGADAPVVGSPTPQARPMAATAHRLAAVVRFRMALPWRKMMPAPRKPMPTATLEATRVDVGLQDGLGPRRSNSRKPSVEMTPNRPAPRATARWVRSPASWSLHLALEPDHTAEHGRAEQAHHHIGVQRVGGVARSSQHAGGDGHRHGGTSTRCRRPRSTRRLQLGVSVVEDR